MPFEKGNGLGRKFTPGSCPNPGGRPKVASEVRKKAQGHVAEALEVLLVAMKAAEKTSERITAAVKVLQIAGVPMTEDKQPAADALARPVGPVSEDDLMARAAEGEA